MFNSNTAIFEWMPDDGGHNFGDYLAQLIGKEIFSSGEWLRIQNSSQTRYVLLGSLIFDYTMRSIVEENKHPVAVCCGYRGEILSPSLVSKTTFLGCRGKHTQDYLADAGVNVECVGDPAVIIPSLIPKKRSNARCTIFMPHINDPLRLTIKSSDVGCDVLLQPSITDMEQLKKTVSDISGASFVLAGAMHAAIIAYAYGVPFAFYGIKDGYHDCPPKWADWLSSISSPYVPPAFFSNAAAGITWYRQNMRNFYGPKYVPILKQYATIGKLRRSIVWKAVLHDAQQMYKGLTHVIPRSFKAPASKSKDGAVSDCEILDSNSNLLISRNQFRGSKSAD